MTLIKRLRATIVGNLDTVVGQIENQDAVVDAIVRDARQALAAAKVRLVRVSHDASRMQTELVDLDRAIAQWTVRASHLANAEIDAADQQKALACLAQRKICTAQKTQLTARIAEHKVIHQRLAADVSLAEDRLGEVLNKQHLMRTRESAANAIKGINRLEYSAGDDLAATFERWDMKITESELLTGLARKQSDVDEFEQTFLAEENEAQLKRELSELMAAHGVNGVSGEKDHE